MTHTFDSPNKPHYRVNTFRVAAINDHFVLYHSNGFFPFEDSALFELLNSFTSDIGTLLSSSTIFDRLKHPTIVQTALFSLFTKTFAIFTLAPPSSPSGTRVAFATDSNSGSQTMADDFIRRFSSDSLLTDLNSLHIRQPDVLHVILLESYVPSKLTDIMSSLCHSNSYIFSYVYRRTFYIDSLHVPSQGTPCHFCRQLHYADRFLNSNGSVKRNWSAFINYLTDTKSTVSLSMPLSSLERGFVYCLLARYVERLLTKQMPFPLHFELQQSLYVDLDTGVDYEDFYTVHPTCSCLLNYSAQ